MLGSGNINTSCNVFINSVCFKYDVCNVALFPKYEEILIFKKTSTVDMSLYSSENTVCIQFIN